MIPRRKKHSNEFRELVIKYFWNGDSEHEIALKNVVLKKYYLAKCQKVKCIANIFDRSRERKTTKCVFNAKLK